MKRTTPDAPLAARGSLVRQRDFFAPLRQHVQLAGKTVRHQPDENLLDGGVSMLADCASLTQLNPRLRPDTALAAAWGRDLCADQSTMARGLEAFPPGSGAQRRTASEQISRREGKAVQPPFDQELLVVDRDLTGLPAGRRAEASTKG